MEKSLIKNDVLQRIKSYKEIRCSLAEITGRKEDTEELDGLRITGYETKFGVVNQQRQLFEPHCFDKFVEEFYVKNNLNLPLTLLHQEDIQHLAGRVLKLEVTNEGFYFDCYIPKTYMFYEQVKNLLKQGILQGLSKRGFPTNVDWDIIDGEEVMIIKEMELADVSLVAVPANGQKIDEALEVENKLKFIKTTIIDDF